MMDDRLLLANLAAAASQIADRHRADVFNLLDGSPSCSCCSALSGGLVPWPCPDRAAIGSLTVSYDNAMLPGSPLKPP